MWSFAVVVTALVFLLWVLGPPIFVEHHRTMPRLPASPPRPLPDPCPLLSVVVPARNEASRIEACVRSVLAQDHPHFEVVVVDDRSEDGTGAIVARLASEDSRVVLVSGAECPPGWAGKNHALVQGVARARGTHLLLLDADVALAPGCLAETHALALERGAGLTTMLLGARFTGFWERALQPVMYQMMMFFIPPDRVNDPAFPDVAMAPGPFLLFAREAYERIGGHAAMKGEIVEDLMLAKRVKAEGLGLVLADGTTLATLAREVDLRRLWEGWSRVTFKGLDQRVGLALVGAAGLFAMLVWPWAALVVGFGGWLAGGASATAALLVFAFAAGTVLSQLACRRLLDLYYGIASDTTWLTPLAGTVAMAVVLNSVLVGRGRRQVVWKGRVYGGEAG